MGSLKGVCRNCGAKFPPEARSNKKFCDDRCRVAANRRAKTKMVEAGKKNQLPEHIHEMMKLAFGAEGPDVIREVLREEIRENITQAVRDNVLGAAEVMTKLLPRALVGLEEDLKSEDWVVRSRAQALLFKYAMSFTEKEGANKDLGRLTVALQAPVPDRDAPTHLETRMIEVREEMEEIVVEDFEKDWPVCTQCDTRKHPDAMYEVSDGMGRPPFFICKTCKARKDIASRAKGREYGMTNDLEGELFG